MGYIRMILSAALQGEESAVPNDRERIGGARSGQLSSPENASAAPHRGQSSLGSPERSHTIADTAGPKSLVPTRSLPKGGGAIRGIGEKFSTNPVNGTGSLSIPITTSGRAGFELGLALNYNSGAGNGPLGIGWQYSTPAITRK